MLFGDDAYFAQRFLKCAGYYSDDIDGIYGSNSKVAEQLFLEKTQTIASQYGIFSQRSENNMATLFPEAQIKARQFLTIVQNLIDLKNNGIVVKIISGMRSYAEQDEIYAQGRTKPGNIISNCPSGYSYHNFGIAWDIGLFNGGNYLGESSFYDVVGQVALSVGIVWGGNFTGFHDAPHYQLDLNYSINEIRDLFEQGISFL